MKRRQTRCKVGTMGRVVHNYKLERCFQSQGHLAVRGPLLNHPVGKWFAIDPDVKKAITSSYTQVTYISSTPGYKAFVRWWGKCLNANSDYGEVWCVPSAMRVSCIHKSLTSWHQAAYYVIFETALVTVVFNNRSALRTLLGLLNPKDKRQLNPPRCR